VCAESKKPKIARCIAQKFIAQAQFARGNAQNVRSFVSTQQAVVMLDW
jgi:hypothetical protein